jgi:hypothetical protein
MNGKRRMFSKRSIVILSIIVLSSLLTITIVGIFLVQFSGPILFVGYGIIEVFQDTLQQDRLLCRTDHQAFLAECRELHRQLSVDNAEIKQQEYIKVPDSELSKFPLIRRLGGRVFASIKGSVWIELGTTMRHFGVSAGTEDSLSQSSSNRPYGNRELVPGLWYYDDAYNRNKNYDETIDQMLKRRRK